MICKVTKKNLNSQDILDVILGSFFIALSAQISVPCFPVPFTLQTLAIFILCIRQGANLASLSVLTYLVEGATGIPVFANFSGGMHVIFGPTGGYLFAFVPACLTLGTMYKQSDSVFVSTSKMLLVSAIMLAIGSVHLAGFVGFENAWKYGFLPFVLSDFVKALTAATYSKHLQKA